MDEKVLTMLTELIDGQKSLNQKIDSLEAKMNKNHEEVITRLDNSDAQNANNHVKIYESVKELNNGMNDLKKSIARVEVATADNWSDIAKLKAVK